MHLFAHAGEIHETATQESLWLSTWYIAIPLFVIVLFILAATTYFLSGKSLSTTYIVLLAALLTAGVGTYTISAPVSLFALTLGFALALLQTVTGLGKRKRA